MTKSLVAIAIVVLSATACGGDDDGGENPEDCVDVRGTWGVTGTCGADICEMYPYTRDGRRKS